MFQMPDTVEYLSAQGQKYITVHIGLITVFQTGLAQTEDTVGDHSPAIIQQTSVKPIYSAPSLSLKKRKKLLSGDNTIEVPSLPIEFL